LSLATGPTFYPLRVALIRPSFLLLVSPSPGLFIIFLLSHIISFLLTKCFIHVMNVSLL
jgi:hypothetical protein